MANSGDVMRLLIGQKDVSGEQIKCQTWHWYRYWDERRARLPKLGPSENFHFACLALYKKVELHSGLRLGVSKVEIKI